MSSISMKASDFSSNWGTHNSVTNGDTNTFNIGSTVNIFGGAVNRFFSVEYGQVCPALTWVLAGKHYNWTLSKTAATGLKRETVGQKLSAINSDISTVNSKISANNTQIAANSTSIAQHDTRLSQSDTAIQNINLSLSKRNIVQQEHEIHCQNNMVRRFSDTALLSTGQNHVSQRSISISNNDLSMF